MNKGEQGECRSCEQLLLKRFERIQQRFDQGRLQSQDCQSTLFSSAILLLTDSIELSEENVSDL